MVVVEAVEMAVVVEMAAGDRDMMVARRWRISHDFYEYNYKICGYSYTK